MQVVIGWHPADGPASNPASATSFLVPAAIKAQLCSMTTKVLVKVTSTCDPDGTLRLDASNANASPLTPTLRATAPVGCPPGGVGSTRWGDSFSR